MPDYHDAAAGSSAPTPLLRVQGLDKSYDSVRALTDVSFVVNSGEVVGLIGDNGAGKSTLINTLSGLVTPESGTVYVADEALRLGYPTDAQSKGIATVFQSLALIPGLSIVDNAYLGRELYRGGLLGRLKVLDKRGMRDRVREGFSKLGLDLPNERAMVASLSGGQRQAVAIARAVLWGGRVMLLDEPNAALGVKQTEMVLSLVERLRREMVAVILISHNMDHVLRVADRVLVLRHGRLIFDDRTAGLDARDLALLQMGVKPDHGLEESAQR